jgi:hypothetical protein
MDWEKVIRKSFEKQGFRAEWVWMGPDAPFLLAWKGRQVQVYYVDLTGQIRLQKSKAIRESFLNFLSHLNLLPQKDGIFKGREMVFRWLMLEAPSSAAREILREAGVEVFLFQPPRL